MISHDKAHMSWTSCILIRVATNFEGNSYQRLGAWVKFIACDGATLFLVQVKLSTPSALASGCRIVRLNISARSTTQKKHEIQQQPESRVVVRKPHGTHGSKSQVAGNTFLVLTMSDSAAKATYRILHHSAIISDTNRFCFSG